jgi:hypothetical protein
VGAADVTRGALYIVRNPLDVAVSFAHQHAEAPSTLQSNAWHSLRPRWRTKQAVLDIQVRQKLLT